ncbi:unnamed protein product [Blepharisma stoltei]|uniref:Uncharacterized protein n=1 Tax=Blepharisma stoltei TaxID=1481888 RepID=A0AAU9KH10_9CILI|nr:unnamed protein product [Blepharisma stoltei]
MDIGVNTESFDSPFLQTKTFLLPKFKKNRSRLVRIHQPLKNAQLSLMSPTSRKSEAPKKKGKLLIVTQIPSGKINLPNLIKSPSPFQSPSPKSPKHEIFEKNLSRSLKKIKRKGNIDSICLQLSTANSKLSKYLDSFKGKDDQRIGSSGTLPSLIESKIIVKRFESPQVMSRLEKSDTCALELTYDTYLSQRYV